MEKQGKLVKKGVAADASIISSAARPRKQVEVESVVCDVWHGSRWQGYGMSWTAEYNDLSAMREDLTSLAISVGPLEK